MRGLRDVRSMHLIHQDCLEWFYCLIKAFYWKEVKNKSIIK